MTTLADHIKGYDTLSENHEPLMDLDDVRDSYLKSTRRLYNGFRKTFPLNLLSLFIDWDKMDRLADEAVDEIVENAGDGMVKEWSVYLRAKDIPEEDWDATLPGIVADVYGSMGAYAEYGEDLIEVGKEMYEEIKETKFGLIERFTIRPILYQVADSFITAGTKVQILGED